jgi:hypothetical protein
MPGLVPGIHVFSSIAARNTWMAGTSPAMTKEANDRYRAKQLAGYPATRSGTNRRLRELIRFNWPVTGDAFMGRYLLLWMIGVPLPVLVLIYAFGGLH